MISKPMAAFMAAAVLIPLPALADECRHVRNIDQAIELDGISQVEFKVRNHDLRVRVAGSGSASLTGRACASSQSGLDDLKVTQVRDGDRLVISLERKGGVTWSLFGNDYANIDVAATLPDSMAVRVDVGSGDADVAGTPSLVGGVGSGDLKATGIPGTVKVSVGSGDVDLADIGELRVGSIGSGDVTAARVRGSVEVGSIGSGDFELYGAGGDVRIGSVGSGDADLRNVSGSVEVGSVGSGDISAMEVRGDLAVRSVGSGDVDHRAIGGRIEIHDD